MYSHRFRNLRTKKQDIDEMGKKNKTMQLFMLKKISKDSAFKGWEFQDD